MTYVSPPVTSDFEDIEEAVYEYVQSYHAEWEPREGHLVVILTEALSQQISDTRELATDVPSTIFRFFGTLVGIVATEAAPATATVTMEMTDNVGYTFPEGELLFRVFMYGDEWAGFENSEEIVVPPGSTEVTFEIVATSDGADHNALTGPIELLTVEDSIVAESVTLDVPTSGGLDDEDEDTYNDRLAERLRLLADRPILPEDFVIYTKAMFPTVDRVLALNLYNPGDDTYGNEKMLTIVPIDSAGAAMPGSHAAIQAALNAVREVNFIINMMAPTYTAVTVAAQIVTYDNFNDADVIANVEAALEDYLSPSNWGQPPFGEDRLWVKEGWDRVRYPELMTVINNVEGVNYIIDDEITINGNVNTSLVLGGEAPLPALNPTINITV